MLVVDQQVDVSGVVSVCVIYLFCGAKAPQWARAFSVSTLHDHTHTRHTR